MRVSVKLLGLLASSLVSIGLLSCGVNPEPLLGERVSGPFAVAGQPGTRNLFVLNSAFTGEFKDGNILRFEMKTDLSGLERKEAVSVPRLGSDLTISPDGNVLLSAFQEDTPSLKVFRLAKTGALEGTLAEYVFDGGVISQLQFFVPADAKAGEHWFTAVQSAFSSTARSFVFKLELSEKETKLTRVARIPDDLPNGIPEDFKLGYSSPSFVKQSNLLLFFPQGGSGLLPGVPHPLETLAPTDAKGKAVDARHLSLLVVDFAGLRSGKKMGEISGFLPLAYTNDGKTVDTKKTAKDTPNRDLFYRIGFTTSVGLAQQGCVSSAGAVSDKNLPEDAILAAEGNPSEYSENDLEQVIVLSGFEAVATDLRALAFYEAKNHFQRKVTVFPKITVLSKRKGVEGIDTKEGSLIKRISVAKLSGSCAPVWLRSERNRAAVGEEVSRLTWQFNRPNNKPLLFPLPVRGGLSYGLLSVEGESPDKNRVFAFSPSFSYGDIMGAEVKSTGFTPLK